MFLALGIVIAPRRTWTALQRGRGHKNLFHRDPLDVMNEVYDELRRQTIERPLPS